MELMAFATVINSKESNPTAQLLFVPRCVKQNFLSESMYTRVHLRSHPISERPRGACAAPENFCRRLLIAACHLDDDVTSIMTALVSSNTSATAVTAILEVGAGHHGNKSKVGNISPC
ncbi:hypothetical protein ECG_02006 [Echinococcus granulosus]|nr:hypothetical protein ECG_02006 [Echinococcus granulosus]